MNIRDDFSIGNQQVVQRLIHDRLLILSAVDSNTDDKREMQSTVDLVKSDPVFDFIGIAIDHQTGITDKMINKAVVLPAVIFFK